MSQPTGGLTPVKGLHSLLTERVHGILKEAIQSWMLKPGEPLVESKLAGDLQVSKTPVRESLVRLAREGLVEATPYKGYRVAPFGPDDARSIMELRAVLEGLAARRACEQLNAEGRQEVLDVTAAAERAAAEDDWAEVSRKVHAAHQIIVDGCGDVRLQDMIEVLNGQYERARHMLPLSPDRLQTSLEDHREIAAAVATRQAVLAEQIMRTHLMSLIESARRGIEDFKAAGTNPEAGQLHRSDTDSGTLVRNTRTHD